jgi:sucrose-6-phosphate hydrolase SacC (GH32 family)
MEAETGLYHESLRPQYHFTAKKGWLNDPNGLVFYKGTYHLFFQHIPIPGTPGGQHWGHAVSPDLVHWEQLANAIAPDKHGPIWSGSAVVDWQNTAGLQAGPEKTLVAIYACAGGQSPESKGEPFTQCLAYSNDAGQTWTKYEHNPVLPQIVSENRDPKVIWHQPSRRWIMALYKTGNAFGLFSSPDLKSWTPLHDVTLPGGAECPDIFEMPLDGKARNRKWIITAANGQYLIGRFDGQKFTKESGPNRVDWGKNFYAVQTFSDIPKSDGRRIQIAWMAWGKYPNMPFDQQMSFPCELKLRSLPEGPRLCRLPVKEIDLLHGEARSWTNRILNPGENLLTGISGELFDIRAEIDLDQAAEVGFKLRGEPVHYSLVERKLSCLGQAAPLDPAAHTLKLQMLLDRTSLEVFANDGRVSMSSWFLPSPTNQTLEIYANAGPCRLRNLSVWRLHSSWRATEH